MATKKVTSKTTTATTETKAASTAMIPWEEQMAKYAQEAVKVTGSDGGKFISLQGGIIKIDGSPVPENELEAVVVGHMFENAYRPGKFDPDNVQPPDCYSFGTDQEEMGPHPDCTNPQGQEDPEEQGSHEGNCSTCWANQWASADTGRGKACKNQRRLALIAGDEESLGDISSEKLEFMRTPVTSSSAWDDHVKNVATTLRRPPFAVVTSITTAPDPKTQFRVVFKVARSIEDPEQFGALVDKHKFAMEKLPFPYQKPSDEPAPARNKSSKFAGKGKTAAPAARGRR